MDDPVTETGAKGPDEKKEPKSDNASTEKIDNLAAVASDKATKVAELVSVLDDYFDNDANLCKQYEKERPIADLKKLKLVQLQKPDEDTLLSAIKESKKLNLTATGDKVRANIGQGRTILILRDLPRDVQYDQIKKLLESEELTEKLESRVKEIRPELNDTWFVRFASQEDCMTAFFWLQQNGKINGAKVKCRVKSVLQASSYNPGAPSGTNANPYADQGYRGFPSPNMYGGYGGPGFSPMMPYPGPYPQYNNKQGGGRGGKRNSRRGRTARSPNTPGVPRQTSVGGAAFPRQQSFRQKGRQKSARSNPKQAVETDDEIYYQGQFVIIGRQAFDGLVKTCCNLDMNEPTKPEELLAFPGLMCEKPKKAFDMKPLTQGSTISPMPGAQPSPPEPEMMSLGKTMVNEAKKGLEDKMKEVKSFKGNKKKETKKAKTDKIINAVQENEDQKEEEVLAADDGATEI